MILAKNVFSLTFEISVGCHLEKQLITTKNCEFYQKNVIVSEIIDSIILQNEVEN